MTKNEAILHFEEYSKEWLSSLVFCKTNSRFCFKPTSLSKNVLLILYIVALVGPHFIHFKKPDLYFLFTLLGIFLSALFIFSPLIKEVVIDHASSEVKIIPADYIGRFFRKTKIIKFSDIKEIDLEKDVKNATADSHRYSKQISYLNAIKNDGEKQRLLEFKNWDDPEKMKAAFSSLLFNDSEIRLPQPG